MTRDTIMAYIAEHPGCSLSEICNSAGCTTRAGQSNIAYILRNLVADGKLVRAKARTGRGIVEQSYRYSIVGDRTERLTFRVPAGLADDMEQTCNEEGITISELARRAIMQAVGQ